MTITTDKLPPEHAMPLFFETLREDIIKHKVAISGEIIDFRIRGVYKDNVTLTMLKRKYSEWGMPQFNEYFMNWVETILFQILMVDAIEEAKRQEALYG